MTERWQQLQDLFHAAAEREPESREAFLRQQTDDSALIDEVLALLGASDEPNGLVEVPAVIGRRVGAYRLVGVLGRGGMGTVYLATRDDEQFTKNVAVKLVRRGTDSEFVVARFRTERQILANLDHPNIAHLLDGGSTEDGVVYLVMELVDGAPIDVYCARHELDIEARLRLFLTVCDAVQYAHQRGVVHRDLKPGNILVSDAGQVKLLDFGIAKIVAPDTFGGTAPRTATGILMMTPRYASPEQVRGEEVTAATDVYALGVNLYELLTGALPYPAEARSSHEIARAITDTDPTPASSAAGRALRGDLDTILLTALQKSPARRYASAEAFADDIRRHLNGLPIRARRDAAGYRMAKFVRRHRGLVGAVVALLAIVVAATFAVRNRTPVTRAPATVEQIALEPGPEEAAVSPDGHTVAYSSVDGSGNVGIWIRSAAGAARRILAGSPGSYPHALSFSSDGRFVQFLRYEIGEGPSLPTFCRLSVNGGNPQVVAGEITDAALSPEGRLAAVRPVAGALGEVQLQTSAPGGGPVDVARARSISLLVWSRDGRALAGVIPGNSGGRQVMVWPTVKSAVPLGPVWQKVSGLAWNADGTEILVCATREEDAPSQIWRLTFPDGALRPVTNDADNYLGLSMAADGKTMVSVQAHDVAGLWTIPRDHPEAVHQLLTSVPADGALAATQDGKIAYITDVGGQRDIWEIDADGSHPKRLTSTPEAERTLAASADGRMLAYDERRGQTINVWVLDRSTGVPRQLTHCRICRYPTLSPDHQWVTYVSEDAGQRLMRTSIDGARTETVGTAGMSYPRASPGGDSLWVMVKKQPTSMGRPALVRWKDGTPTGQAVPRSTQVRWSGPSSLLYIDPQAEGEELREMTLSGGDDRVVRLTSDVFSYDYDIARRLIVLSMGVRQRRAVRVTLPD
jgi:Tol biopolymer transport system component